MPFTVTIPDGLAGCIRKRGFDVEERLGLDPREELEARLDVAWHMLRRVREELERGDAVQASEKLYKAVEECIKVLACVEGLEECERAKREGEWWSRLARESCVGACEEAGRPPGARGLGEAAFNLHVHGFHEHALNVEDVEQRLLVVEELVEYTGRRLGGALPPASFS